MYELLLKKLTNLVNNTSNVDRVIVKYCKALMTLLYLYIATLGNRLPNDLDRFSEVVIGVVTSLQFYMFAQ